MALAQPPAQGFDLILDPHGTNPLGLMLDRTPGRGAAVRVDSDPGNEPVPDAIYADFSGGMGCSELILPSTYGWGENVDTTIPGVVLPGGKLTEITLPSGGAPTLDGYPLRSSFEYGGHLYFVGGRYVVKVANGTGVVSIAQDFGNNVATSTDACAQFGGNVYVGTVVASTNATWRLWKFDGTTWTEYDGTGGKDLILRRKLAVVYWDTNGTGAFRLIGMPNLTGFQTVSGDPTVAANWTSEITVGSTNYSTASLAATARHVYFVKQDGVWDVDARGYSGNLTPYWEQNYDLSNGVAAKVHQGYIYATCNLGLDRVPTEGGRQDIPEFCQPGEGLPNGSPVYGYINAMASDRGWIVAALVNTDTNTSYICYGRPRSETHQGGYGPLVWHGALAVVAGTVTHLRVSAPSSGARRLWICANSGTTIRLLWMSLPKSGNAYQDWRNGGAHRFASSYRLNLPDGWEAPTARRVPWRYDVHADNLTGGAQISVSASYDRGAFTFQGAATTSPRESFIAADVSTGAYRVDLQIDGQGTDTTPPILRAIRVRADVNREQTPIITYRVRIAQGQSLRLGVRTDDHDAAADTLWGLQSEQGTPITIIDPQGREYTGQILPGVTVVAEERRDESWDQVVEFRVRMLYAPWNWDSGVTYDAGRVWS